jgi:hypothetical protein
LMGLVLLNQDRAQHPQQKTISPLHVVWGEARLVRVNPSKSPS